MSRLIRIVALPFLILAAIGFGLSLYAHGLAVMQWPFPWGDSVWMLHVGILVVWAPTVLVAMRMTRNTPRKDFWKTAMSGCPRWMRWACIGVIGYAAINFFYFVAFGQQVVKTGIDPAIRVFSGHWLVFYGVAFATLSSALARPDLVVGHRCPAGHAVDANARYCSTCGAPIGRSTQG